MKKTILKYLLLIAIIVESVLIGYSIPRPISHPAIDPELKPYLEDFIVDAQRRGLKLDPSMIGIMAFAELPGQYAGFCNSAGRSWEKAGIKQTAVILISDRYRGSPRDDYTFKTLVYHELGHCLLYKGHDPEGSMTIMSESPLGYPYEYDGMSKFYNKTWQRQLDDLFLRSEFLPPPSEKELLHGVLEDLLPAPLDPKTKG